MEGIRETTRSRQGASAKRSHGNSFLLDVADDAPNARVAETNRARRCERFSPDRYDIQVIDVFRRPKRALAAGVFGTPTRPKTAPLPTRVVTDTLDDGETTLMERASQGGAR